MIRTKEMDDICEYGVSSLWTNKDADVKFSENYEKYNDMKKEIRKSSNTVMKEIRSRDICGNAKF